LLRSEFFKTYRRHSFVAILILAALITPSPDVFTMFMLALPLQLLYELSRLVVKRVESKSLLRYYNKPS